MTVTVAEALAIGTRHLQAGQLAEAERIFRQILSVDPRNADALCLLGTIAIHSGHLETAVRLLSDAIRVNGSEAGYYVNLAETYRRMENLDEAIRHGQRAIQLNPQLAVAHSNLGLIHQQRGDYAAAASAFREAIRLAPDSAEALMGLGRAHFELGNVIEAETCLRRAVAASPHDGNARFSLGRVLYAQFKLDEATDCFRHAAARATNLTEAYANLATVLSEQGQLDEAIGYHRAAIQAAPENDRAHSSLLYILNYHPNYDAQSIWEEHRAWGRRHADPLTSLAPPHANDRTIDRRLRVGYVSPHFWSHAVNFFTEPVLASHDHAAFEIFCYSDVAPDQCDDSNRRLRGYADCWRDILGKTNVQVDELIRSDRIDILVDLTGHIRANRILLFAHKPAPVQVTYIGYQNTTGMAAMDYRLTDAWADPPGTADRFYTEKLVRLPRAFFCYLPSADAPGIVPPPVVANGFITFGSFNNFVKITPQTLATWAELLRGVPNSRLLVLAKVSPRLEDYVHTSFDRHGIDPERIEICSWRPRHQYLDLIARADIALDAFPFNGHTTTCDALWQGVPVVTLAGETYVSRFGSSAHVNLGLEDLIARSVDEYVQIATELAKNRDRLVEMRAALRGRMLQSPLLDARGFTRNLEEAYRQMWTAWCQSSAGE